MRRLNLPLVTIVTLAAAFLLAYTGRVSDWIVMTDELLYAKLSLSISETLSPLPVVHGETIALSSQLYPLLTAPLYGMFDMPTAFHAVHLANAVFMASAAIPGYLLARQVVQSQAAASLVAALTVAVPWVILSAYALTEVVAYPVFIWSMVALQRAVAAPTPGRDVLTVAAIGLAILARTQFIILAVLFPLAVVGHEIGYRRSLAAGLRAALVAHRWLAATSALGLVAALGLAAAGSLDAVLGPYAVTATSGSLLPDDVWRSAAAHLDAVVIGIGVLPFVVAVGWTMSTLLEPADKASHAFAILTVLLVPVLTLQAASFDVRFGDGGVRDRYLFYVASLLFVGMVACLAERRRRWLAVAAAALMFGLIARYAPLDPVPGFWEFRAADSPASALHDELRELASRLRLEPTSLIALTGITAGVLTAIALARLPRASVLYAVAGAVLVFGCFETGYAFDRLAGGNSPSGRPIVDGTTSGRDWIDRAVPPGARVGLVPFPVTDNWGPSAVAWWDAEFWNKAAKRTLVGRADAFSYTPETFPRDVIAVDFASGRIVSADEPRYLVMALNDVRVLPRADEAAIHQRFRLLTRVHRPYRAEWATRGLDLDGWTRPNRLATVRLFGSGVASSRRLALTLLAPAGDPRRYTMRADGAERSGDVPPGRFAAVELDVCLPAVGHADVTLTSSLVSAVPGLAQAPGGELTPRLGGLRLFQIDSTPGVKAC